jgi:DNA ligase (NAD+)
MKYKELKEFILKHQKLYYNGIPEISDEEFDKHWNELKDKYPDSKLLTKVGSDTVKGFKKIKHWHIMGSQNKCANMEEFKSWFNRKERGDLITQIKLDGASIALHYKDGKFEDGVTRGDGLQGDLITSNILKMKYLPLQLKNNWSGQIRGEVLLFKEDFKKYFSDEKNCRNSAVGTMKRKNGEKCEHLSIIVYDAYTSKGILPVRELPKLQMLEYWGFKVVPYKVCNTIEDVENYRNEIIQTREKLEFDIDGLVIKDDIIDYEDLDRDRPLNSQVALKFDLDEAVSIVRNVEFYNNFGQFTPVAIFDPIQLNGTQVSRASLANTRIMKELNLKIGSKVKISKRGEIIPKIISVLEDGNENIIIPTICPCCGESLIDNEQSIFCKNINCDLTKLHNLKKWIDEMEIQFIGPEVLEKLYYQCNCKEIHNLFELEIEDISKINRMGEKSAQKIIKEIRNDKNFTLDKIISGVFDNRLIGSKRIHNLIEAGYNTYDKLKDLTIDEIKQIDGWSDILANEWYKTMLLKIDELNKLLI